MENYKKRGTQSLPKWKCPENATVQKLKNNIFLGPQPKCRRALTEKMQSYMMDVNGQGELWNTLTDL